jgi:hypothetical protein
MKLSILSVCLLAFLFTFSTQTFAVDFTVNLTTDQHDANTDRQERRRQLFQCQAE